MTQPDGLAAVYEDIRPRLRRLLIARTGDPSFAEDLLQSLWIKLQTRDDGPVGNAEAYLFRMAHNLVTDHARAERQRQKREDEWVDASTTRIGDAAHDEAPDSERILIAKDELQRVRRALAEMPARASQVFQLHRIDGLSHADIAAQLDISKSAVEKNMAVALKHLFRLLSG